MSSNPAQTIVGHINQADAVDEGAVDEKEASYLSAFGLYLNPFSLIPDNKFYFESPALKQRLQTLSHMVENNKALLCVTGDEGGGKTSLLRYFVDGLDGDWRAYELSVTRGLTSKQLLNHIAESFQADAHKKESKLITNIFNRIKILNQQQCFPVLVIDDGHQTDPKAMSALQKLVRAAADKELKMSVVLFANREIRDIFNDCALRDVAEEWVYNIYLPRLSEKDLTDYLLHRMTIAGMLIDQPFKSADVSAIYKVSKGLPGKVNEVAHRMLLSNFGDGKSKKVISPGWLNKLQVLSLQNKIYLVMGIVLLIIMATVSPQDAQKSAVGTTVAMQTNKQPAFGSAVKEANADSSKPNSREVKRSSKGKSANECKGMTDIFLDCGEQNKVVQKNISYR